VLKVIKDKLEIWKGPDDSGMSFSGSSSESDDPDYDDQDDDLGVEHKPKRNLE